MGFEGSPGGTRPWADPKTPYSELPIGTVLSEFRCAISGITTKQNGKVLVSFEVNKDDVPKAFQLSYWTGVTMDCLLQRHDFSAPKETDDEVSS